MITPVYAALLGILLIVMSVRVIRVRRREKVAVGEGESVELLRAMRAQANFVEYVPLTLLLIFFGETLGAPGLFIHGLCVVLLVGRAIHGFGVSQVRENFRFRVFGMICTFLTLCSASLTILVYSI